MTGLGHGLVRRLLDTQYGAIIGLGGRRSLAQILADERRMSDDDLRGDADGEILSRSCPKGKKGARFWSDCGLGPGEDG